jgi:hypothetical protein
MKTLICYGYCLTVVLVSSQMDGLLVKAGSYIPDMPEIACAHPLDSSC